MKGISAIVATILLLLITVGLAGTAYFYITNLLARSTSKAISVLNVGCDQGTITIVLANDGTDTIQDSEIRVLVDNQERSTNFDFGTITVRNTTVASHAGSYTSGSHTLLVTSPSNTARQSVFC